jgi:hypothetical protein
MIMKLPPAENTPLLPRFPDISEPVLNDTLPSVPVYVFPLTLKLVKVEPVIWITDPFEFMIPPLLLNTSVLLFAHDITGSASIRSVSNHTRLIDSSLVQTGWT